MFCSRMRSLVGLGIGSQPGSKISLVILSHLLRCMKRSRKLTIPRICQTLYSGTADLLLSFSTSILFQAEKQRLILSQIQLSHGGLIATLKI